MIEWLFPGWSNPALVASVAAARLLLDLTVLVAVLMVSVLRPGGPGRAGSNAELLAQGLLLVLGGYATSANPSTARWIAFGAVALAVLATALPAVVLYGEATVAP